MNQNNAAMHQPKGSMCLVCIYRQRNCSALPFGEMPIYEKLSNGAAVVICREFKREAS